jgi:hypothetical protein
MTILFTKAQAVELLPFIEDTHLSKAVDLALWLYLDKHWRFKNAINKAAEKHRVKPKVAIERVLRQVIPEEVFYQRMSQPTSKSQGPSSKDAAIRSSKLKSMERNATSHLSDISHHRR